MILKKQLLQQVQSKMQQRHLGRGHRRLSLVYLSLNGSLQCKERQNQTKQRALSIRGKGGHCLFTLVWFSSLFALVCTAKKDRKGVSIEACPGGARRQMSFHFISFNEGLVRFSLVAKTPFFKNGFSTVMI